MNDELAQLQSQLDRLSSELRAAQRTINGLERRTTWRRPNVAILIVLIAAVALGISSWSTRASSVVGRSTFASDTAPTKVKAPFEVDDDNGIPIMIVQDPGSDAKLDRGLYIIDQSRREVARMGATDDDGGGGRLRVEETGPFTSSEGSEISGVEIIGTKEKSTVQVIRAAKKIASIGGEQGDKGGVESGGSIQIFGANEKPIATLSKGKNGGELTVYDAKNKKGATVGTDTTGGLLSVYSSGDKPKATLATDADGGLLSIYGTGEKSVASLKSDGGNGKLSISEKGGDSVVEAVADETGGSVKVIKKGDDKTYTSINALGRGIGLSVRKAGTQYIFAGANTDGGGTVDVSNAAGDMVDSISTINSRGLIAVFAAKHAVAFITESDKHPGGGNVTTTNPAGEGIFSAGFTGEGGDACIDRKGGLKCLGINLPLQINP
jgi:hypothetical protein